jgi:hypothetical protein
MLLLAAVALAGSAPSHAAPVVQARATVRILSGARLRFGEKPGRGVPHPRNTTLSSNGVVQPARLFEFE